MAYEDLNTRFVGDRTGYYEYYETTPGLNSIYPTIDGINSIKQGIERLLTTPKGHDPFNREYGSSLYNLLFENVASMNEIQMFLYMDILDWEPRVELRPQDISIAKLDNNTYRIDCNFTIREYNVSATINTTITRE